MVSDTIFPGGVFRFRIPLGCSAVRTVARDVTGLTFTQSANELTYVLTWNDGLPSPKNRTHEFRGRAASRALATAGSALAASPGPPAAC